jgi:hypothetical protein
MPRFRIWVLFFADMVGFPPGVYRADVGIVLS